MAGCKMIYYIYSLFVAEFKKISIISGPLSQVKKTALKLIAQKFKEMT